MPKEEIKDDNNVASVGEETLTSEAEPTTAKKDKKKGLGTGAIVGISIAGAVVLAGVGVGGAAIGAAVAHGDRDRGGFSQNFDGAQGPMGQGGQGMRGQGGPMHNRGVDPDGDNWTGQNQQGQMGQNGQMPQMPNQQQNQSGSGSTSTPNAAPAPQSGTQNGPLNGFTRGS